MSSDDKKLADGVAGLNIDENKAGDETVAPDADVEVVDQDGKPLAGKNAEGDAEKPFSVPVDGLDLSKFQYSGPAASSASAGASASAEAEDDEEEEEETPEEAFVLDARYGEHDDVVAALEKDATLLHRAKDEHTQNSALTMACANGHTNIVRSLLFKSLGDAKTGAKAEKRDGLEKVIDCQNTSGNTALHYAALNGREECVKLLLIAGASCDLFNEFKKKAFDDAHAKGFKSICELLAKRTNMEYCSPEPTAEEEEKYGLKNVENRGGA